jgi:hypothetical protein
MLMTTSEPAPADVSGGMTAEQAAALYRLMTWLSPSFPVGAFSYSSGIEWAVEAGDITDAASLRDWLAAMLTDGSGYCDAVFLAQAYRAASATDDASLRGLPNLRQRSCRRASASSRHDAGPRLYRHRARRLAQRRARRHGGSLCGGDRLSRRRRPRQRGACGTACAGHACLPACRSVELDFCRRPAGSARARPTASASSPHSRPMSPPSRSAHWKLRSTTSAAPPFAPISPACATRPVYEAVPVMTDDDRESCAHV